MRMAGTIAAGLGGTALGALLMNALKEPSLADLNSGKPSHAHYNTQIGHAINNAERGWTNLSDHDYAVVEGARQGLMGDRITSAELDELILSGAVTPQQARYLEDVHNFGASGAYNDPRYEAVAQEIFQ